MATIKACDWCGIPEGKALVTVVHSNHAIRDTDGTVYRHKAYELCGSCKTLLETLIQESQALGRKEGWLPPREDPGKAKPDGWSLGWGRKG